VPLLAALVAQIPELPGLGDEGPGDLESLLTLCFVLMAGGFAVGLLGHLIRSRLLVGLGIAVVMVGTVVFAVAVGRYG
jgi:hypothetical protein